MATGSEVSLAMDAKKLLDAKGVRTRVVSMPCWELFDRQPQTYRDAAVGDDNLFRADRYKWSLRLTAINITNKYALYNFLSTFSGTHYVSPRSYSAELGFHF
jgi:transketolase